MSALTTEALTVIDAFRGQWAFLSNFHPAVLNWEGITYPTAEHAFNAGKTLDPSKRLTISQAPTPREAKRLGRAVQLRPDWDVRVRFEVMAAVLRAKFACREERANALLSTGRVMLIEGNTWHDQVWGDCRCGREPCAEAGANHLGELLMELREDLW